jgi:hypothetical protein
MTLDDYEGEAVADRLNYKGNASPAHAPAPAPAVVGTNVTAAPSASVAEAAAPAPVVAPVVAANVGEETPTKKGGGDVSGDQSISLFELETSSLPYSPSP